MIAQESIERSAMQHYYKYLSGVVANPKALFEPLKINRIGDRKQAAQRFDELTTLAAGTKKKRGFGYRIVLNPPAPNSRHKQSTVKAIVFDTLNDILHFLEKAAEYAAFCNTIDLIRTQTPYLLDWCAANVKTLTKSDLDWPLLLPVVQFFREHPQPNLPLRLLPIAGVDTKFIEQNNTLLCALLDVAVPESVVDKTAKTVARRFGLPELAPLVECCWNCPELTRFFHGCTRLAFAANELPLLELPIKTVTIIENRACLQRYLAAPRPATLVVFGSGFGTALVRDCKHWLALDIQYWGDIDAHGFAILNIVRNYFPNSRSLWMDEATWQANQHNVVQGKQYAGAELPNLKPAELALFRKVQASGLRLEQERVEISESLHLA